MAMMKRKRLASTTRAKLSRRAKEIGWHALGAELANAGIVPERKQFTGPTISAWARGAAAPPVAIAEMLEKKTIAALDRCANAGRRARSRAAA